MRVLMILFALVLTPFVASVSQGRGKPARPARREAAAKPAAAQSQDCQQQQGQHQGNNDCGTVLPPPPPPPPPPTCAAASAPAGDVMISGMVYQDGVYTGLAGWCVQLYADGVLSAGLLTNSAGMYNFTGLAGGATSYMVCLVVPSPWTQTYPTIALGYSACSSGNAGYAMSNLPPGVGSSSPFNDFGVR